MVVTNYEPVGKGLDLLREGLAPFVAREFESKRLRRQRRGRLEPEARGGARRGEPAQADMGQLAVGVSEHSGECGTESRVRAAWVAQQVGASGKHLQRRCLSGTGLGQSSSGGCVGAAVRGTGLAQEGALTRPCRRTGPGRGPAGRKTHRQEQQPRVRRRGHATYQPVDTSPVYIEIMEPLVLISITVSFREGWRRL